MIRDPVARRRHGNGEKVGFCQLKRAKSGICGSSRRDLPTCASACVIERKRRLSRGLRRSGESCGALFGRYDLPWWRALTQKYFDGREFCGGLAQAIRARVEQRTRRFALGRGLWRQCKIGSRAGACRLTIGAAKCKTALRGRDIALFLSKKAKSISLPNIMPPLNLGGKNGAGRCFAKIIILHA